MRALSLGLIAALLGACLDTETRAALGERCTFNDECAAPLICSAMRCRTPCRTDRDCTNGWRCKPSGQYMRRVCLSADETPQCIYASECDRPLVCARDRYCRRQCSADYDCTAESRSAVCDVAQGVCSVHVDYDAGAAPRDATADAP